ncbi:hypothetical protein CANARDRAFT_27454 [[Candida] arabinofermentans NRRL YB-2248]|uniref:Glucosamine 6-phosphate N-acetyltransferase n=1 Tax=[Candida] arabinofermentans NRRL YB-2248 TaxID=983967 RepID=A0A1E4T377_9ASCO|nr:hypothetical protein CANARDRAFT_27454 [[Candida] arabinofermentans NRRL YB-2248]
MDLPTLPEGYKIRPISKTDYSNGVLETLATLTTVGPITQTNFEKVIEKWHAHPDIYKTLVIVDDTNQVAAIGTLLIELKLIHDCSNVGHIEDIAVNSKHQGLKFGKFLILKLIELAKLCDCYKVILDCDVKNQGFYEKCGLKTAGLEMEYRF